jgi:hypothetical protein
MTADALAVADENTVSGTLVRVARDIDAARRARSPNRYRQEISRMFSPRRAHADPR